jgi:hypothetical protein
MSKDEALDLALEALKKISKTMYHIETPPVESLEEQMRRIADKAITAIKQARSAPVQEPVATLWQHGETGRTRITMPGDITDCDARWFKAADLYTTPPAQPAPVQPVQEPVAIYQYQPSNGSWIDQDKFSYDYNVRLNQATVRIVYTTPPAAQRQWTGLTDEEIYDCDEANACRSALAYAIEAKLKEKNNG